MGLRKSFWLPFFGVPRGVLGSVGARLMPRMVGRLYPMLAKELALRPDDDLLDIGCGSARLLAEQAAHVRHIAGLDASDIQVRMARKRLAERIAAGTAEIVQGNAMSLPWKDGRFSVVSSLNCLKFVPDPPKALREMHRVLRAGGRLVITIDKQVDKWGKSGEIDAFGQWQWGVDEARRMVEEAGFSDVSIADMPTKLGLQFIRGAKRALPSAADLREAPTLVGATSS
ncbi:MAG TPA: methyltransferase domain-containing protein [Candidatus Limnocylindrales bacterium]